MNPKTKNRHPKHAFLPNCDNPQVITNQISYEEQGPRTVGCGWCYSCLGKKVNIKSGQLMAEFLYPQYPEWEEPGLRGQFWTLTYNPESLPMTEPVPHDLALNWEQTGPYTGPFVRLPGRTKPAVIDGVVYHTQGGIITGRPLTPGELALEQQLYLQKYLKWTPEQIFEWRTGTYPAVGTLVLKHVQDFKRRLQTTWHREFRSVDDDGIIKAPRWAYTGEYGDNYGRPHYHVIPFGWPTEPHAQEAFYDAWADYTANSIVDPGKRDAMHLQASHIDIKGGAPIYSAKDLAKDRRQQRATPTLAARTMTFIRQSTKPPLGIHACEVWLGRDMYPIYMKHNDDTDRCYAMRQAYIKHTLHLPNGGRESFITTKWWRNQVQGLFDPECWDETTHRLNSDHADLVLQAEQDSDLMAEAEDYVQSVAEKNRRNEKRALDRKARKSAVRLKTRRF